MYSFHGDIFLVGTLQAQHEASEKQLQEQQALQKQLSEAHAVTKQTQEAQQSLQKALADNQDELDRAAKKRALLESDLAEQV